MFVDVSLRSPYKCQTAVPVSSLPHEYVAPTSMVICQLLWGGGVKRVSDSSYSPSTLQIVKHWF